jgi:hypothetical protein
MKSEKHSSGFTVIELLMAIVLGVIITGSILILSITSQRLSSAILEQIQVQESSKKAVEIISRDLRGAERVEIYSSYPGASTTSSGNCILIYFPSDQSLNNVGYYYLTADKEIRKVLNIDTDDGASFDDDKLIAENVEGSNIFSTLSSNQVSLIFRIVASEGSTRKTTDIDMRVTLRN